MRAAFLASTALLVAAPAVAQVTISPGQNIQAAINAAPAGTTFNLASGTFAGTSFTPKNGDSFVGAANGGTVFQGGGQSAPMVNGGAVNVTFQNVTLTNFGNPAQSAPLVTAAGWQLINVTSTNNAGAGLYLSGQGVLVSGGSYSNNGQIGIDGSQANGSTVENATISGNNTANYDAGWDAGGIKVTETSNLTVTGNTVSNNKGQGIWADISSSDWTITDNGVSGNTGNGIQYEISHGATIDNNLVTGNLQSQIYVSNSDGVTVSGNGVEAPAGQHIQGDGTGGGIAVFDNSGRGNDPNTGQPYLSNNDTVTGNQIVGLASDSGIRSAIGPPSNDTFANNTFLAAGTPTTAQPMTSASAPVTQSADLGPASATETSNASADPQSLTPAESAPAQESAPAPTVPPQPAPVMVTAPSAAALASSSGPTTAPALNPGPLSIAQVAALAASGGIDPSTGPAMPPTPAGCPTWGGN